MALVFFSLTNSAEVEITEEDVTTMKDFMTNRVETTPPPPPPTTTTTTTTTTKKVHVTRVKERKEVYVLKPS